MTRLCKQCGTSIEHKPAHQQVQLWLGFVILGIGLPYLAWTLWQMVRDAFLRAVGV